MADDQAELRKCWRQYNKEHAARHAAWAVRGYQHPPPAHVPYPDVLRGLTCGAKTRAGTPCKRRDLYKSGRCKLHGGLSTGPKRTKPELTPCAPDKN
ncbi:MAG: HGGxSTG domain-containing protein [Pseudomonas sp.]|uniref:HGGxSTG domain-containing protein n=1 Tax=Pseudomonas sp. TaxID=306 RepID=UPI0027364C1B|nr:HGGxSTG domain-containing protein [Pseudomonas sp.]MDP3845941.1 HGGxSTG domain-containing protein [Pseudomonas sp.]